MMAQIMIFELARLRWKWELNLADTKGKVMLIVNTATDVIHTSVRAN